MDKIRINFVVIGKNIKITKSAPVVEFETLFRVRVSSCVTEGGVLEAVRLHPVELVVDVADQAGGVLVTIFIIICCNFITNKR